MANAFSQLDTSFPSLDGKNTEAKIQAIQDYLYQLLEQLRYTLNNINPDNFNETEVNGWAGETIVKPIHAEITDVENGLITYIDATAAGVTVNVQKEYAAEWTSGTTYYLNDFVKVTTVNSDQTETVNFYKDIYTTNPSHTAAATNKPGSGQDWQTYWVEVAAADVAYSRFDITADAIRSEVSRAKGAELSLTTSITQTADAIRLEASRVYAPLWDQNGTYYKDNIVHTESGDPVVVKYWMCTADSTTQNPLDVSQTDWLEVPEANILNSRFQVTADAITSEVDRATAAEGQISSQITQKADEILLQVKGDYAVEWEMYAHPDATAWVSGTTYALGDTVKSSDVIYKCIEAHTAASANQPPNATYWAVDAKQYYENDVVKVTTIVQNVVTAVDLYKCLQDHSASAATKPPAAAYWEVFTEPTVQSVIDMNLNGITLAYDNTQTGGETNASYIKLHKDGIDMGGGLIKVTNLDASTITTGELNAGDITLNNYFNVYDDNHYCGQIGGFYTYNAGEVFLSASNGSGIRAEDTYVEIDCQGAVIRLQNRIKLSYPNLHNNENSIEISDNSIKASDGDTVIDLLQPSLPLYRFTDMTANTVAALLSSLNANKSQIPTGPSVVVCGNSSNSNRCMVMIFKTEWATAGRGVTISPYTAVNNINVYLNSSGDWAQASS